MVICVRKLRKREMRVREVCNAHCVYGRNVYGIVCRENMADINVRVREVKSSSKVGKK